VPRRLAHSARLLLAVLIAGGVLAPSVHEVWHAGETARIRASHLAEATHHHHEAGADHGPAAVQPCPEPLMADWACVLCHGVSVHLPAVPVAVVPPASARRWAGTREATRRSVTAEGRSIRGPPGVA